MASFLRFMANVTGVSLAAARKPKVFVRVLIISADPVIGQRNSLLEDTDFLFI